MKKIKAFKLALLFITVILLVSMLFSCEDEKYDIGELISFTHSASYDGGRGELVVAVSANNVNKNVTVTEYTARVLIKVGAETVAERKYTGAAIAPLGRDEFTMLFSEGELGESLAEASVSVFPLAAAVDGAEVLYDAFDTAPSLSEQWLRYFNTAGARSGISTLSVVLLSLAAAFVAAAFICAPLGFKKRSLRLSFFGALLPVVAFLLAVAAGGCDVDFSLVIAHLDFYDFLGVALVLACVWVSFECIMHICKKHAALAFYYSLAVAVLVLAFICLVLNMLVALNLWVSIALSFFACLAYFPISFASRTL